MQNLDGKALTSVYQTVGSQDSDMSEADILQERLLNQILVGQVLHYEQKYYRIEDVAFDEPGGLLATELATGDEHFLSAVRSETQLAQFVESSE